MTERKDETEREPITMADFTDAVKQVLLAPVGKIKSENRMPTKEELNQRWKLEKVNGRWKMVRK